jgi:hypothetical protein
MAKFAGVLGIVKSGAVDMDIQSWSADVEVGVIDSTTTSDGGWESAIGAANKISGSFTAFYDVTKKPTGATANLMVGSRPTLTLQLTTGETIVGGADHEAQLQVCAQRRHHVHGIIPGGRRRLDLTELTDEPELTVQIGGKTFHFSELPIGSLAKLQAWIKANVPDPLVTLRERLAGYPESVVAKLTADVRQETPNWPPIMGSR